MNGGEMMLEGRTLLLLGHGSTKNQNSSAATRELAVRMARVEGFDSVVCGFWKEAPLMREVLDGLNAKEVFIVPHFTVEGHFVRRVIPEALGLSGRVTQRESGQILYYCKPVGSDRRMVEIVLNRARAVAENVDFAGAMLLVAGHGTPRDVRSRESVDAVVEAIREREIFAAVHGMFLEVEPKIENWRRLGEERQVIVVPFFISDGLHGEIDVPELLGIGGMARNMRGASKVGERELYYGKAVGTDEGMVEVVMEVLSEAGFQR